MNKNSMSYSGTSYARKPLFQLFPDLGSSRYVVRDSEISVLDTGDRKEVFRFYEPHQQEVLTILYEKNTQNGLVTLDLDPIYQQTYKILNGRRTGQYAIYRFGVCCYMGWWKSNGDIDKQCYIEYTSKASMMVHCDPSTGAILYRGGMGKKPCEYEGFGVQYDLTSGKPLYYGLFHNNRLYRVYQRFLDDESMIEYGYKDDDLVMNSKQEELSEYLESKPQQPKGFIVYRGNYKPHPYLFFMRDGEGCETRNGVQRYGLWRKNKCVEEWTIDTSGLVFDHLRGYVNDAFLKGDAFDAKTNQPKKLQRPKMPKLAKNDSIDKPKISVNTEVVTPNVEGLKPSAGSSQNPSQNPETQQEPDSHTPKSGDSMNSQSVPSILQYSKSRSAQSLPKNVVPNTQSSGSFTPGNRNGTPSVPRDSIRAPVSDAPNSSTMASTLQSANSTTPVSTNGPISGAQAPKTAHNSMQNNQSLQDPTPVVLDAMANLHTYSNGLQTGYSNEYPTPLSNLHRSSALLHASSSTSLTQSQRGPVFNDARMMFGKQGVVPFIPGTSNSPVVISQRGLAAETASNEKETLVASMADFVTASREIEHLTIADGSCNEPEFLSFDVHSFSKLVSIRIGDNCCTHVLKFNLFRVKALETVYIGKNSFRCEEKFLENTEFVLEELDCMTKLEIGENSFEFFHSVELRDMENLASINIGANCFRMVHLLQLENLPSLKELDLDNNAFLGDEHRSMIESEPFNYSNQVTLKNLSALERIYNPAGESFVYIGHLNCRNVPNLTESNICFVNKNAFKYVFAMNMSKANGLESFALHNCKYLAYSCLYKQMMILSFALVRFSESPESSQGNY